MKEVIFGNLIFVYVIRKFIINLEGRVSLTTYSLEITQNVSTLAVYRKSLFFALLLVIF